VFGGIPVVAAAMLALLRPVPLAHLENGVYDLLLRRAATALPDPRILIVDIDERSLSEIGQWPWRRDVIGRLIAGIRDGGAATIALDVIFSEPDRHGEPDAAGRPDVAILARETSDDLLAVTLRGSPSGRVVLGHAMTFESGGGAEHCLLHPLNLAIARTPASGASTTPFFRATGSVCNLKTLSAAAGRSGFLNAAPDTDGLLRRAPLLIELNGQVYPSLALRAVIGASDAETALDVATVNAATLRVGERRVPLDGRSNLLLRYRGPRRTFPYVSAADVVNGRISDRLFEDKVVFVGTTALGTREVVSTPLDTLFVGVEVQATIADNLLQRDFIYRPASGSMIESLGVLGLGLLVTLVAAHGGLVLAAMAGIVGVASTWTGALWLLSSTGVYLSPVYMTCGTLLALASMTVARVASERRRANTALSKVENAVHRAETAGQEATNAQRLMIETLLSLTETRDADTGAHSRRTSRFARLLAEALAKNPTFSASLTPQRIELLATLAPLHDIGKVGVPDAVLNKPGALTAKELVEMQRHPVYGLEVIQRAEQEAGIQQDAILAMAKEIVYTHHERWDGTGYPRGLRGPDIPIVGRLMAVVDVYDACTGPRVYQQPLSHEQTIALIAKRRGHHFDPDVVDAFLTIAPLLKVELPEAALSR
jgi:adenylate cyclase